MIDYSELVARLRCGVEYYDDRDDAMMRQAADALEAQGREIDEIHAALIRETDRTQDAWREKWALEARLAEAEALLRECEPNLDEGMETEAWRSLVRRIDAFLDSRIANGSSPPADTDSRTKHGSE